MKKRSYPAYPERMKENTVKFREATTPNIPILTVLHCKILLHNYYGSDLRAALHMLWYALLYIKSRAYWSVVFWICDRLWTEIRPLSPGGPYGMRHGRKCQYANCSNINCCEDSIPDWFQNLTRFPK